MDNTVTSPLPHTRTLRKFRKLYGAGVDSKDAIAFGLLPGETIVFGVILSLLAGTEAWEKQIPVEFRRLSISAQGKEGENLKINGENRLTR